MRLLRTPILLLALPGLALQAQPSDPLWLQALAQLQASAKLVANETSMCIQILDGAGKSAGTSEMKCKVTGWKGGEPVRSVVSHSELDKGEQLDPGKSGRMSNHPEESLSEIQTAQRLQETVLDGQACVLFQVTGLKKGKIPYTGKVWVEKAGGLPLKAEFIADAAKIPMTKAMGWNVLFGRSGDGHWVPRSMTMEALVSVMFMKIKTSSQWRFEAWSPRP